MSIVGGRIHSFEEAARLAFQQDNAADMQPQVASLFAAPIDHTLSSQEIDKLVRVDVRTIYGKDVGCSVEEQWQVPVPLLRYEAKDQPRLIVEGKVYLVARVWVSRQSRSGGLYTNSVTPAGKLQKTVLTLSFLSDLLDNSLDHYQKVGKDGGWTTWQSLWLKQPMRLHDDFVTDLTIALKRKPVRDWLEDFGSRGRQLVPLVVGGLLGLRHQRSHASTPLEQQPPTRETLIDMMTGMGYGTSRAEHALELAEPELRKAKTMEEAVPIVLKYILEEK